MMKNFHVPLPVELHAGLQSEAKRDRKPATALAREAIARWLEERRERAEYDTLRKFAEANAGTDWDLNPDFENASLEHIAEMEDQSK